MNKDEEGKNLFDEISFEDDLIIEGAELNNNTEITEEEQQGTTNGVNKKKTNSTETDSNEDQLIDFDEPLDGAETDSEASSSDEVKNDTGASSSSSPLSLVASALVSEGLIEIKEGEDLDNIEDPAQFLRDKITELIDSKAKSALSPEKLKALEAFEKGVPMEEFVNSKAKETQYSSITAEAIEGNEQLQQQLIAHSLLARGMSEDEILDTLKVYKDVGGDKLKEKAFAAQKHLIANEYSKREQMLKDAEEQTKKEEENRKAELTTLKEKVTAQKEFIKGLELTDKVKDDIYKVMTTPVDTDKNGNPVNAIGKLREKDPQRFNMLMTYYFNMGLFNEQPDLSKLQKVAENKVANGLNDIFKEGTNFMGKAGGGTKEAKSRDESDLGLEFIM